MPRELPPTRSLVIPWEGMGWVAPKEEPGLPCSLGPRRKWGFQEATVLFLSLFLKGRNHSHLTFPGHLLICSEMGSPSFLDHGWELRMKGPKVPHFVSLCSLEPCLFSAKPKSIHSFSRHLLRTC